MSVQRRLLPSISALAAFEAAARTGGFTAAAQELNLTQGAVSRQIRALEEQLDVALFIRCRQRVTLTAAGEAYAVEVRGVLSRLGAATLRIITDPQGGALNLATLPTFGSRWLAPRMPAFLAAHPGVTINIANRLRPFEFRAEALDAAIHFGFPGWSDASCEFLMGETVVPVCAPDLLARMGFAEPADLLAAPLLHLGTRPEQWPDWFTRNGVASGRGQGMHFEQFATSTQATIAGLGVALLPTFLITPELERGDLALALDLPMRSRKSYYLAIPNEKRGYPPVVAFREWIMAEMSTWALADPLHAAPALR